MAVNRVCIITFKKYKIFTFKFTIIIFIAFLILASILTTLTQYIFPCCPFVPEQIVLSFIFINPKNEYDVSYTMIFISDILCSLASSLCYVLVFISIRNSFKQAGAEIGQNQKDLKYVIQFVFISVFYVCTWVFFEVFPKVVPKDIIEYFWIITIMVILNASSNSVIFLTCNQDVKRSVNFPWTKKTIYTTTALSKFSKATVHN
ncbi:hypothetical protein B9Z55_017296 [Caenorhabditis nigoni]|uniref:7TM GPCR serpentine receptor class x (Srx) domain-containing protein n=1 Tax=Caenorhabditis nigoni TaxID=1611254 RepID=A0A2G5T8V9_9PELO|nr:hypothetical protein B9Z55_017296 [Caenorhabditis nigoni]